MELRKRITVLVPKELSEAFKGSSEHVFVVSSERGKLIARPIEEHLEVGKIDTQRRQYLNGYAAGMTTAYQDGYRQGYNDGRDNLCYDDSQSDQDWYDDDEIPTSHCSGGCEVCRYYDVISDCCGRE